jgi:hypothetical protein
VESYRLRALARRRKRLTTQWHAECLEGSGDEEVTMTLPFTIATVVSLSTLLLAPVVFGQSTQSGQSSQSKPTPSQADFDACNKQAVAKAGNPSASPRPRTGPMVTGPGTPATGTQSGPAPSASGTTAGSTPPGTAGAGSDRGAKDMRITGSEVPGAREAGLTGMAPAGLSDVAYQEAYSDCMERRGF